MKRQRKWEEERDTTTHLKSSFTHASRGRSSDPEDKVTPH